MVDGQFQQFVFLLDLFNFLLELAIEFHLLVLQSIDGVPCEFLAVYGLFCMVEDILNDLFLDLLLLLSGHLRLQAFVAFLDLLNFFLLALRLDLLALVRFAHECTMISV